jgi:hypothetical protein
MARKVSRDQVLAYRMRVQQLDRASGGTLADTSILDIGVQDTGPDGGLWALANRGVDTGAIGDELATVWTLRGAPHTYRRADLPSVAAATAPLSEADAGKRIFDAQKTLKAAGIGSIEALDTIATQMRAILTKPMVKGEVSTELTRRLDEPYVRFCRPCNAVHAYEMTFRLGALRGGIELQASTSPPVMQRIIGFKRAKAPDPAHDVVRSYLHLLGPATQRQVAAYVDAPLKDIKAHWPEDAVEVACDGETRWTLAGDEEALFQATAPDSTRLLGPFDLFLQLKDRELLVDDPKRAKALWPVLGRPGAVLHRDELLGLWRPRQSGRKLTVAVELWGSASAAVRAAIEAEAARLAGFRGTRFAGVTHN